MSEKTVRLTARAVRSLLPERFRLEYALVAANTHEAITAMRGSVPKPGGTEERAFALLEAAAERAAAATRDATDALKRPPGDDSLTAIEKAVTRFLDDALIPSMQVLHAGIALELTTFREINVELRTLRSQVDGIAQRPLLNYRVRYNIACFLASEAVHERDVAQAELLRADALAALERALASAPLPVVGGLVRWAVDDPSLSALRTNRWRPRFDMTLRRFGPSDAVEPPSELSNLDAVGPLGAEVLRRIGVQEPDDMPYDRNRRAVEWLTEALGVPYSWAERWVDAIGLAGLPPLTPADVNALWKVGVRNVPTLAVLDPVELHAAFESLKPKPQAWTVPKIEALDHWVMAARRRVDGQE